MIDAVTSALADRIRYVGDWREVDGGFVPRPLKTIASTGFGDCKDFSISTIAILRHLGFEANPALIERGPIATPIPSLPWFAFNHAIVSVKLGGSERWIDPTNLASFAHGTFEDILDRDVLVMSKIDPHLTRTPAGTPEDSLVMTKLYSKLATDGSEDDHYELTAQGRHASQFAGIGLQVSQETLQSSFLNALVDRNLVTTYKFEPFDMTSRITKDFTVFLNLKKDFSPARTTMGPAFGLKSPEPVSALISLQLNDRVSDYFIGYPSTHKEDRFFEGLSVQGRPVTQCQIDSRWLYVHRNYVPVKTGFYLRDEVKVKQAFIINEDLHSRPFQVLQDQLRKCFYNQFVVYKKLNLPNHTL